jgi:hypothetical protein
MMTSQNAGSLESDGSRHAPYQGVEYGDRTQFRAEKAS